MQTVGKNRFGQFLYEPMNIWIGAHLVNCIMKNITEL